MFSSTAHQGHRSTPKHNTIKLNGIDSKYPIRVDLGPKKQNLIPSPVVFCINLNRSPDRFTTFVERFANQFAIHRVEAYDYKTIRAYTDIKIPQTGSPKELAEIARSMSHIKAIRTAYCMGLRGALIMEDDVTNEFRAMWQTDADPPAVDMSQNSNYHIRNIISRCPQNFDVLSLCTMNTKLWVQMVQQERGYRVLDNDCWVGSCYYISRNGMQKIIRSYYSMASNRIDLNKMRKNLRRYRVDKEIILKSLKGYIFTRPTFHVEGSDARVHMDDIPMGQRSKMFLKKYLELKCKQRAISKKHRIQAQKNAGLQDTEFFM